MATLKKFTTLILFFTSIHLITGFSSSFASIERKTTKPKLNTQKHLQPLIASSKIIKHRIKRGDTLFSLLTKLGFSKEQVKSISRRSILPKYIKLKANEEYFTLKRSAKKGKSFAAIKVLDPYNLNSYLFWRNSNRSGQLVIDGQQPNSYNKKKRSISGQIKGSLISSIRKHTKRKSLSYRFIDAYSFDFRPEKVLQKGDRFSLSYEELYLGKTFIRIGRVLNTSLEVKGKAVKKKFIPLKNGGVFVSKTPSNKRNKKKLSLFSPVSSISVSSPFNRRRLHPITKRRIPHLGVDLVMAPGSPVYAAQSGVVKNRGYSRAGGHFVRITHKNGFETSYNHLKKIDGRIKKGRKISAGETVGTIGCSGYCTKPHLHFQVKKRGRPVDPVKYTRNYPFQYRKQVKMRL